MQETAADHDDVRRDLEGLDAATFTSLHVLDRVPAIFESREQYARWRSQIGAGIGVDPLNLVVVGSTSVGVSLSPNKDKLLRPFHPGSDVDLAIISPRHFDQAWRFLRSWGPVEKLRITSTEEAELLQWHRRTLIFDGTIATERLLSYLEFGSEWATVLGRAGRTAPTQNRDVKGRIYRDFESLREYHQRNVEAVMARIKVPNMDDEPISLPHSEMDETA